MCSFDFLNRSYLLNKAKIMKSFKNLSFLIFLTLRERVLIILKMETTEYQLKEYQLKSKPGTVRVPSDYAHIAERVVNIAMEHPEMFKNGISENPYLENSAGIIAKIVSVVEAGVGTPEALKLQDEIYLGVCMHHNKRKIEDFKRMREEAVSCGKDITQTLENL